MTLKAWNWLDYMSSQIVRLLTGKPLIHCWTGHSWTVEDDPATWPLRSDGEGFASFTCMRAWGHLPPHDFVPDSEIGLGFPEYPEAPA